MSDNSICKKHQKNTEYLSIDKSNQSKISFHCQQCIDSQDFQKTQDGKKVIPLKNLLDKARKRQQNFKEEVTQLIKLFQDFTDQFDRNYKSNNTSSCQLQQQLIQLENYPDKQTYAQLEQNPSFQQLIQEEGIEVQDDFFNNLKNEFQQFTKQVSEIIDKNLNVKQGNQSKNLNQQKKIPIKNNTLSSQSQNQNRGIQSENLNQCNQSTKSDLKTKKIDDKKNEICRSQENNQTEDQKQNNNQNIDPTILEFLDEIIEKNPNEIKQNHNNQQLDKQSQQTPKQQQPKSNQDIQKKQINQMIDLMPQKNSQQQQQQVQVQESLNQNNIPRDIIKQEKPKLNQNLFKIKILKSQIKKILVVTQDIQMVASKKTVGICKKLKKNNPTILPIKFQGLIVDIQLIDSRQILIQFTDKLEFYNQSLIPQQNGQCSLSLIINKFAYEQGILYYYNDQAQSLIKQQFNDNTVLVSKNIAAKNDPKVVAIKIVGEFLHVGFSKGMVQHYKLSTLEPETEKRYQLKKQEFMEFKLFYFEQDYCIGVQQNYVHIKFYHIEKDITFCSKETINQCSYLINLQKEQLEIQCLQENGRVFTFKMNGNIELRNDQLKYKDVSSIQACPKFKKFYYGYTDGKLKCVKQKY